jgi:DNA-binding CsgD family transcriptional regulator
VEAARAAGDAHLTAWSLNTLGFADLAEGNWSGAGALLAEALRVRRAAGDDWGVATSLSDLGKVALAEGDLGAARARYEESLAIRRRIGHLQGIFRALGGLARIAAAGGDLAGARRYLDESQALSVLETGRAAGLVTGLAGETLDVGVQVMRGAIAAEMGDAAAAGAAFRRCLVVARDHGPGDIRPWHTLGALAGCSWVASHRGDHQRAARLGGAAAFGWDELVPAGFVPALRVWFSFLDRWLDSARRSLATGREAAAWAAGRAMTLQEAIDEALALEDAADGEAASRVEAPRPASPASPASPTPVAPGGLTAREREVAVLVARGHSNPQVARELVIAPRTAARHVEHVMAKLGVHSRAEIAAWAAQQGLLESGGA